MSNALEAIRNGAPVKETSRKFGISPKTLRRHRDGKVSTLGKITLGNKDTVFSEEQESQLVQHIQSMEKALFGLTRYNVRALAYELAVRLKLDHPFASIRKLAGVTWLNGFMTRHQELSLRIQQATNLSRAVGFNRPQVMKFFSIYKDLLTQNSVDGLRIWNVDEQG